jgi:hypothetical protein
VINDKTNIPMPRQQRVVSDDKESEGKICPYLPGQPIMNPLTGVPQLALMGCIGKKCRLYLVKGCGKALDDKMLSEKLTEKK